MDFPRSFQEYHRIKYGCEPEHSVNVGREWNAFDAGYNACLQVGFDKIAAQNIAEAGRHSTQQPKETQCLCDGCELSGGCHVTMQPVKVYECRNFQARA